MAIKVCVRHRQASTLVLLGLLFHVFGILAMIDTYFRSPVVHGMEPHAASMQPPAKRVVLFVGMVNPPFPHFVNFCFLAMSRPSVCALALFRSVIINFHY